MNKERTYQLFLKHIKGNLTPLEKQELEQGLQEVDHHEFDSWVDKNVSIEENNEFVGEDVVFDRILKKIDIVRPPVRTILPWYRRSIYRVAAACVVVSFCMLVYYGKEFLTPESSSLPEESIKIANERLELPDDNALVTLADGTQMLFDASSEDTLRHKGLEIARSKDGSIVMRRNVQADSYFNENDRHTLSAPKGVALRIFLPDSTAVWLNSGSTITILASYGKKDRNVELDGEGFFDVTRNKLKPFIVRAKNSVVKVLGTQFNLSAYSADAAVKTTLIQGSVDVSARNNKLRLIPGQQAVVSENSNIVLNKNVNINEIVDWKEGYFRFNDKPVGEILTELAKWYPIEEVQMQVVSPDNFTGSIKRSKKLGDLLDAIASVSDLKFVVQGRRVIVMK